MKRLLAFLLLLCLLLCGCELAVIPTEQPTTEPATETTTAAPTEPSTEPLQTTPETEPRQEKVTIYLLEKSVLCDSGYTEYSYDENYNLDSVQVFTIENDVRYTSYFEEKDSNGMFCKHREDWGDEYINTYTIAWFEDGKLKEILQAPDFSGYQYEYDQAGNLAQKREYYEGILMSTVSYEYDGDLLLQAYCVDPEGNKVFECRVEDGRIVEKICYEADGTLSYSDFYEYDENGNLVKITNYYDGEEFPGEIYTYRAVEVGADRANYLLEQQKYLLSVA